MTDGATEETGAGVPGTGGATGERLSSRTAHEVRVAVGRLSRRLRGVSNEGALTASQSSVLARIANGEADTAAALAALDGVRPQSVATTVAALEGLGLLARAPDPADGRRSILRLTTTGEARFQGGRAARQEWLARALEERLTPDELARVLEAAVLLQRLTAAHPAPPIPAADAVSDTDAAENGVAR